MSTGYAIAYRLGVTPWEKAGREATAQFNALLVREQEGDPPFGRALDIGCGTGDHAVNLAQRGWNVTGVDLIPRAIEAARAKATEAARAFAPFASHRGAPNGTSRRCPTPVMAARSRHPVPAVARPEPSIGARPGQRPCGRRCAPYRALCTPARKCLRVRRPYQ